MKSKPTKFFWRFLKIVVIVYTVVGLLLYFLQEKFLFHPKALPKDHKFSFQQPFEEINLNIKDRNLNIVQFTVDTNKKGIVLYFHGNRRNIERYAPFVPLFTTNGYEVWMIDYPGFGKSTGEINEETLYNDAELLYKMAMEQVAADSIIIYGKSIGTGIASYLASKNNCKMLILETPYYSILSLAKHYLPIYPVNALIKYSLPTNDYLKKVEAPVTAFHGTDDEIIPYKQAKKLKKENKNLQLITIEDGKHNNLAKFPKFTNTLDSLMNF